MKFFDHTMESVFIAMNVRRSGPEDDKQTYVDMTMLVEIPFAAVVPDQDVGLTALLFDNARMAIKSAKPSSYVCFPKQDLSLATMPFEDVSDGGVAETIKGADVKAKDLYPANEGGHGATMKLQFSFVVGTKRQLALLAELIGEPIWFKGIESTVQDEKKSGGETHSQADLFTAGVTDVEISDGDGPATMKAGAGAKLRAVK